MPVGEIESLDHEARGVTHLDGKAVFIEGALPGETVEFASYRVKPSYELARMEQLIKPSPGRVAPPCPHFGICGGCSVQHADLATQLAAKQRVLEDCFQHIGGVTPEEIYAPIYGKQWHYRHRARVSVRLVVKKGGVLVGFHEKKSSYIADMRECRNLPRQISDLLLPLRDLVGALSIRERLPQIEVAVGARVSVLVLRILEPLTTADAALLSAFGARHGVEIWLQPKGPETAAPFYPPTGGTPLSYRLPEFDLEMFFAPTEFTQVNPAINRVLVRRAVNLLAPQPDERIADLFCGLGNFTLPLARSGATVVGVEGAAGLIERAGRNAAANGLAQNTAFRVANLFTEAAATLGALGRIDKMLIDPPREGAVELVKALGELGGTGPERIVYVSCNPATLARDAAILVKQAGYALRGAGVVNMFPNTSHVESIALFTRADA